MESGLTFVMTHLDVEGDLPVGIIEGHCFRQATDSEIVHIKDMLSQISNGSFLIGWPAYESIVLEERTKNSTKYQFQALPKEKWKYWVLAFNGTNHKVHELEFGSILLEHDIEFGFSLFFEQLDQQGRVSARSFPPSHLIEKFSSPEYMHLNAMNIRVDELKKIEANYLLHKNLTDEHKYIDHALRNFSALRSIPRKSELLVVGYFSIIESLITHAPRLTESLDSISHQLLNKMLLLNKRYSRKISMDSYFLASADEKLWKKLYSYRSCVAHGNKPDFQKEFQILKSQDMVTSFLREQLKELILLAMREPVFISDLRKC